MAPAVRIGLGAAITALGGLVLAIAVSGIAAITVVWLALGSDGEVSSTDETLESGPASIALVVEGLTAEVAAPADLGAFGAWIDERGWFDRYGTLDLVVASPVGSSLVVGEGDGAAIAEYLFGAPYSVAVRGQDGEWIVRDVPGRLLPPAPETGPWTGVATGDPARLPLEGPGAHTIVIVNADRQPGVAATLGVAYRVGGADSAAYTAVAVALTLVVIGLAGVIAGPALLSSGFRGRAGGAPAP